MKLLEIKNNLAKISYQENESLALGRFVALVDENSSYVGQIVNLTAELSGNFAIAKLIFTFNKEGIVDSYDGTIPSLNAKLSSIKSSEILNLLPLERPVTFGCLAQQGLPLKVDETIFEKNLLICAEKFNNVYKIVDNSIAQLEKYNEKTVVIDTCSDFADCEDLIRLGRDFKLPLNLQMTDYILNIEEADTVNKAVIEDIFEDVREYAKTVDFIPFDLFVDVVSQQYKETNIPELALLKDRLIKYKEANIFVQNEEEYGKLSKILNENQLTYLSISDVEDSLQTEAINYIHKLLDEINLYIFVFVKLNNKNSDKKLLKRLLENEHIFTSVICGHNYKYLAELKARAENLVFFAPQTVQHDFAGYNTLLNKLNADEFIVYGALTQHIPFIAEFTDSDNAVIEEPEHQLSQNEELNEEEPVEEKIEELVVEETEKEPDLRNSLEEQAEEDFQEPQEVIENDNVLTDEVLQTENLEQTVEEEVPFEELIEPVEENEQGNLIEPIENLLEPEITEEPTREELENRAAKDVDAVFNGETVSEEQLTEADLDFIEEEINSNTEETQLSQDEPLTDEFEEVEEIKEVEPEQTVEEEFVEEPLPVFPAEENDAPIFEKGDTVTHPKYGKGVVEKLIKYGNKTLCSISFEEVGRRLLDPAVSELSKI